MIKRVSLLATAMLFAAVTVQAEEPVPYNCDFSPSCEVAPGVYGAMGSPVMSKFNLSIGGYVKLDYAHNSNGSGPTSTAGGTLPGKREESIFTAKQSRFWLKVAGPNFLGAKTNALIEADFYGAGSSTNEAANMRMRHAYGSMDWTNTQVLFGQFWDIFGPATADTLDFRQGGETGTPNNPRVPQIRLTQKVNFSPDNSLKLVLGVQNPTQTINSAGANASASDVPATYGDVVNAAGQAIFTSKALGVSPGFMGLGMAPLQLGAFGLYGSEKLIGNTSIDSYGYGLYAFVPVLKSKDGKNRAMTLSFESQGAIASNLAAPNASSPMVTLAGANSTVPLYGPVGGKRAPQTYDIYGQLKFYATQDMGITAGAMRRGAVDYGAYRAAEGGNAFEKYSENFYGNVTYDLNAAVRVATEFEHIQRTFDKNITQTAGSGGATNYAQNNIIRLSAYYFF